MCVPSAERAEPATSTPSTPPEYISRHRSPSAAEYLLPLAVGPAAEYLPLPVVAQIHEITKLGVTVLGGFGTVGLVILSHHARGPVA